MQTAIDIKKAAHQAIDQLPTDATWDDVLYRLVERREIELGLADSAAELRPPIKDTKIRVIQLRSFLSLARQIRRYGIAIPSGLVTVEPT